MRTPSRYEFAPERYEAPLTAIIQALLDRRDFGVDDLMRVLKRHPKDGQSLFSKAELIRGFRYFGAAKGWRDRDPDFVERLRAKPVRTESGVAPITVLSKPFPCPGHCIFCPNDVRMPKSYLAMEPGAQRAAQHAFDPFGQTHARLRAFDNNGHRVDKIELIILGGTWSFYPEAYQIGFIKRCFDAMNDFGEPGDRGSADPDPAQARERSVYADLAEAIDGRAPKEGYNTVISRKLRLLHDGDVLGPREGATWAELEAAHARNEAGACRCVGLSVETRPDHVTEAEVVRIRRLGVTKVQIGYQSLSDEVLAANKRGHDVAATRQAMARLRLAGFKIHAHWMPNLYGSTPERDIEDFAKIFEDPDFRPDELKIYPCSLIESAELMQRYEAGTWRPYEQDELLDVLAACLAKVPRYCRLTRIIRDIPSHDILVGNKQSNLRELATTEAARRGIRSEDIRAREIRGDSFVADALMLRETAYDTAIGREVFIELVTAEDRLVAFLRLSLPTRPGFIAEIEGSAMIREVHVYGVALGIGERSAGRAQHAGLGRRLIDRAAELARQAGYTRLAVISAVGTRRYYADLGFTRAGCYQDRAL